MVSPISANHPPSVANGAPRHGSLDNFVWLFSSRVGKGVYKVAACMMFSLGASWQRFAPLSIGHVIPIKHCGRDRALVVVPI